MGLKELDAVDWLDPPEPAALRQAVRALFLLTLTPYPYPCPCPYPYPQPWP